MSSDVPYLRKEAIENEAASVLAQFGREQGEVTAPPVPIDEIVELHLKLNLAIMDLQQIFGFGDVHGAIWFRSKKVGIDQSLDPHQNPARRNRYHFTLAHEAGHWRLHRSLYLRRLNHPELFTEEDQKPDYVCRSSEKKKPVEWQADQFAANLLMPRDMVKRSWQVWRGTLDPICLPDLRAGTNAGLSDEALLEAAIKPLAATFEVSTEAMRIRAEELGFLLRKKDASLF